jgi:hypothetical protein
MILFAFLAQHCDGLVESLCRNVYLLISISINTFSFSFSHRNTTDTSESLNFISPSATREDFTAGITERCRKIQQPGPLTPKLILNQPVNRNTTTAYFDINSGTYSTIVSRSGETNGRYFNGITTESFLSSKTIDLQSPTVVAHANKKPSYLNLACCVNGYSNYTNYDSIERKEINKSRDVSPIRPIISMSRQPRSNDNLLSVPGHTPVTFVKQSPLTSITKRFASLNINDKDTPDNAGMINGNGNSVTNRKSFIQQRVEKLYGTTKILTSIKSSDSIQLNGNGTITHLNGSSNGSTNGSASTVDEKENDEISMNSLPVMKHLRPEFAKQLQFMSSPKKSLTRTSTGNVLLKSEQLKTDPDPPQFKSEQHIISSGNNNNITSSPPLNKTNEISIVDLINSESVRKDCDSLMDNVVNGVEKNVVSEKKIVNIEESNINGKIMDLDAKSSDIKDGHYFLRLLNNEKTRILTVAADTEKELEKLQSEVNCAKAEICLRIFFVNFCFLLVHSRQQRRQKKSSASYSLSSASRDCWQQKSSNSSKVSEK